MPKSPINLAVLVSGSGTTLQNLIDQIEEKKLDARIKLVIGSRAGLPTLPRAIDHKIPYAVVDRREFADVSAFSKRIFQLIDKAESDLVCLAGWLCVLEILPRWQNRVMYIHP